jgi:hypothetical protein
VTEEKLRRDKSLEDQRVKHQTKPPNYQTNYKDSVLSGSAQTSASSTVQHPFADAEVIQASALQPRQLLERDEDGCAVTFVTAFDMHTSPTTMAYAPGET